MLLGAVGAYDWNGTVVMHTPGGTIVPEKTQFYNSSAEAGYEGLAGYLGESGGEKSCSASPLLCEGGGGTQDASPSSPEELLLRIKSFFCH